MHIALAIGGGLCLLAFFLLFGRHWGDSAAGVAQAAKWFVPVWVAIAVLNLWVGVSHAGYPLRAELPVLALVIAVPTIAAIAAIWFATRV